MLTRHLAVATTVGALIVAGSAFVQRNVDVHMLVRSAAPGADSGWTATLSAPAAYSGDEHVSGTSSVEPDPSGKGFVAHVNIEGAKPKSVHPWHVHTGTCDKSGGIVGPAGSYPPIETDDDGKGMATATVSTSLDKSGSYIINVHQSKSDMGTIIACGQLASQ